MFVEHVHEGIGIELFDIEHAFAFPRARQHHGGTDHRGNAGGVAHGLVAGFGIGVLMIADLIEIDGLGLAILHAGCDIADIGLALGGGTQARWFGQHGLEELERDDLLALIHDRVDAGHADILQHFEMLQIGVAKGHPETDAFDFGIEFGEAFQFLMIHEVHILLADLVEVERLLVAERRAFDPFARFPVTRWRGHFADVDFRVEVGREMLAMVAAIAVENVERVDRIEQMLLDVAGEHAGHAGVETRPQQRHDAGFLEAILIGPLPAIFELGRVARFVIGCVEIVGLGREARVHDVEVLIGQGQVDDQLGLHLLNERDGGRDIIGIDLRHVDGDAGAGQNRFGDLLATHDAAAGQRDVRENIGVHRHLVNCDRPDAACADDQNLAQSRLHILYAACALKGSYRGLA